MPVQATRSPTPGAGSPHPVAFSIHLSRNVAVQGLGMGMVVLMGLSVLKWPLVLIWTAAGVGSVAAEHLLLRRVARQGLESRLARIWAPMLRVWITTLYAFAALVLISRGGPGERLFAFALMCASMVHVLMRYYRSPKILAASLAPYMAVLAIVGFGLTRTALHQHHWLAATASLFAVATFVLQFWSARGQLAGAWDELMAAREAAEQRERAADAANKAKSQFLANMSHELRTPLNGVLGMVQALSGDRLTTAQQECVGIIKRSSESLLLVLNDLLDLSKIESSALELELVEFDLADLVRGAAAAYEPLASRKALGFDYQIAVAARGRYRGDSARIRRILYSLADNAVKFTDVGGVSLSVDVEAEQVVFRVTDSGIGIGEDDLTHLFEGFFQADASLTRRHGGAGIGLAVSRDLAGLMGGALEASSRLGEGSTFTLRLPLTPVCAGAYSRDDQPAEPPSLDLRVLAAEDNPVNQLVLKSLLAAAGVAPTMVENGRQALDAWEGGDWDVILMDIQMPEMNGVDATRAIRSREGETGRIRTPIVAVTANAMAHQLVEYQSAGIDGVVPKPVDMANLFEVMDLALSAAAASAAPGQGLAAG